MGNNLCSQVITANSNCESHRISYPRQFQLRISVYNQPASRPRASYLPVMVLKLVCCVSEQTSARRPLRLQEQTTFKLVATDLLESIVISYLVVQHFTSQSNLFLHWQKIGLGPSQDSPGPPQRQHDSRLPVRFLAESPRSSRALIVNGFKFDMGIRPVHQIPGFQAQSVGKYHVHR